jgi:hypothetical protein
VLDQRGIAAPAGRPPRHTFVTTGAAPAFQAALRTLARVDAPVEGVGRQGGTIVAWQAA